MVYNFLGRGRTVNGCSHHPPKHKLRRAHDHDEIRLRLACMANRSVLTLQLCSIVEVVLRVTLIAYSAMLTSTQMPTGAQPCTATVV